MSQGSNHTASPPVVSLSPRWRSFAVCLLLAAAVWAVFGQTLHHQFVNYDDGIYVCENPLVTGGLTCGGIVRAFTQVYHLAWFPLTTLSHMLDWQLYGANASGHHLTNVLLHAATAILLFLVLRMMTGAFWRAAFVAAVFALHPLRVESVAWVTERKDVLSGLFFMLTLWAYLRHVQRQKTRNPSSSLHPTCSFLLSPFWWLALLLFALGLLSKPMIVTLPFVLLLLDYWPLNRIPDSGFRLADGFRLIVEKIPFLLLAVAAALVTLWAQQTKLREVEQFPWPWRLGNALMAYADYLWHMVYPSGLALVYPHPGIHLPVGRVILSVLVLVSISAGVLAGRRRHPYLLVGWLWYLGMLLPVIDIMQAGDQARADRYTYLPQIGLGILVAWGAVELCGSWHYCRAALGSAAAAILAALIVAAHVQTAYWKDSVSLWTHTLACTSANHIAHNGLGSELAGQGKFPEAVQHYQQALQLKPNYAMARYNLGIALARQGKFAQAIQQYEQSLQLKPDYADARINLGIALAAQDKLPGAIEQYQRVLQLDPDQALANNNLGIVLARQGKLTEAIQHYERALQSNPDYADAHFNLAGALVARGRFSEAIPHYEQALQLKPGQAEVHYLLAVALAGLGRLTEAIPHYQQAVKLKPDFVEARINLSDALIRQGRAAEAIPHCERALQLKPDQPEAHVNLADALVARRKLTEAIPHYQRALQLKPDYAEAHFNLANAWASQGKSNEALSHFQQALTLATAQTNTALADAIRTKLQSLPPP